MLIPFIDVYNEILEMMSAGYTTQHTPEGTGFSYSVKPLSFNLQQGCRVPHVHYYKFHVGDKVQGISPINDKEYSGIIKYLYYKEGNEKEPFLVYILNFQNNDIIPLYADNLKKIK